MNFNSRMQGGFTFLEVMAVVAISGTLAAMSVPMIKSYSAEKQSGSVQETFAGVLEKGREFAVASGLKVTVCPSENGVSCSEEWSAGVLAFAGDSADVISEENVLAYSKMASDLEISVFDESSEKVKQLQFDASGYSRSVSRLTATFCSPGSDLSTMTVERTGRLISGALNPHYEENFLKQLKSSKQSVGGNCHKA